MHRWNVVLEAISLLVRFSTVDGGTTAFSRVNCEIIVSEFGMLRIQCLLMTCDASSASEGTSA